MTGDYCMSCPHWWGRIIQEVYSQTLKMVSTDFQWVVFKFTSLHYLLTVSLITICCGGAMTFSEQLCGRQVAISFEATPSPGDRQRDEWRHTEEGFISLIAFIALLQRRHVSTMIKHSGYANANANANADTNNCNQYSNLDCPTRNLWLHVWICTVDMKQSLCLMRLPHLDRCLNADQF